MDRRTPALILLSAIVVVATVASTWVLAPRPGQVARGATLARHLGCEGCHGPGGTGGVANPRSDEREIPALTGGTWMMYVESEQEIREWILDGRPARLSDAAAGPDALIEMPSYRGHISEGELDDLVAWYRVASGYQPGLSGAALDGRKLAGSIGCFGCHGTGGRVGVANPGSFKGYIPGWGSADFYELVRSERELREWIQDGVPERLERSRVAQHFTRSQLVKMPSYRAVLSSRELDQLVAYIDWVSDGGVVAEPIGASGPQ